jgi:RNA polymerase sigma factor (sigma-70 family)
MVTMGWQLDDRDDPHDLVERAFGGDSAARSALVARLMPVIQARVRRRIGGTRSLVELEDAVQEIWLRLVDRRGEALRKYDAARGASFEGYVGMIAERELGNHLDKAKREKRGGHMSAVASQELEERPISGLNPEEQAASREQIGRIAIHVEAELPAKGQRVFRYLYTDGAAAADVACAIGVNVQVVYNWQHKIREIARRFMAADPEK